MAKTTEQPIEKKETSMPDGVELTRPEKQFVPPADIYETNDQVVLVADMPAVAPDSVDITLEDNVLTILGRVRHDAPADHNLSYCEYEVGDYRRAFTLSDEIDPEKIEARLKHGVLTLTLPKTQPTRKKIAVKVK